MSDFPAISQLKFPFCLKEDQTEAVNAWINNNYRGTILYSTGTGKTEIAFECARRIASEFSTTITTIDSPSPIDILLMVPRIILIEQNIQRLVTYGIPREKIGAYFGERKEVKEITICTYQSVVRNLDIIRRAKMVIFDESTFVKGYSKNIQQNIRCNCRGL